VLWHFSEDSEDGTVVINKSEARTFSSDKVKGRYALSNLDDVHYICVIFHLAYFVLSLEVLQFIIVILALHVLGLQACAGNNERLGGCYIATSHRFVEWSVVTTLRIVVKKKIKGHQKVRSL